MEASYLSGGPTLWKQLRSNFVAVGARRAVHSLLLDGAAKLCERNFWLILILSPHMKLVSSLFHDNNSLPMLHSFSAETKTKRETLIIWLVIFTTHRVYCCGWGFFFCCNMAISRRTIFWAKAVLRLSSPDPCKTFSDSYDIRIGWKYPKLSWCQMKSGMMWNAELTKSVRSSQTDTSFSPPTLAV